MWRKNISLCHVSKKKKKCTQSNYLNTPLYLFSSHGQHMLKKRCFGPVESSLMLIESIRLQLSVCKRAISSNWLLLLNVIACLVMTHTKGPSVINFPSFTGANDHGQWDREEIRVPPPLLIPPPVDCCSSLEHITPEGWTFHHQPANMMKHNKTQDKKLPH